MPLTGISAAPANRRCFVCGPDNPRGMHISFWRSRPGEVSALWDTCEAWQGFDGIIHGGVVSTVLDEAMSQAVSSAGVAALTCELRVRLRRKVATGERLEVSAWVVEMRKRRVAAEAALRDVEGCERAHAWAVFLKSVGPAAGG